ncbi:MAG: CocE/NonD family hydrolase [bacterium]
MPTLVASRSHRLIVIVLATILFSEILLAQDPTFIKENYSKKEVLVTMRDGVRLFTSIYAPKDSSQDYPIILNRTPYSVAPYGPDQMRASMVPSVLEAKEKFIFVYQDVRGRNYSEGEFVDIRPYRQEKETNRDIDETTDAFDTVDWLVKNIPRNNGRVGITGISYPGFYTTMGTIDAHPAVKATSPQAPICDPFIGDDEHHNGAFFLAQNFNFYMFFGWPRLEIGKRYPVSFKPGTADVYKFFLELGPLSNVNKLYFHDSVTFWNKAMQHETFDTFWKSMTVHPHLNNIKPAVLTVGGWYDQEDMLGPLKTYKYIEKNNPQTTNMLVMGPWSHGQWNRDDAESLGDINFTSKTGLWFRENVQFPFFNYYLKGKGDPLNAEAIVFETGRNTWHKLDAWPPKDIVKASLFLQADGKLGFTPKADAHSSFAEFVSDPAKPVPHTRQIRWGVSSDFLVEDQRFASTRPDVLVFKSDLLTEDVTLVGPVVPTLYVSTTGTDADWVVKLIDVFPGDSTGVSKSGVPWSGFQQLIRGDVIRGKFRNSFSTPEPFIPNKVTKVEFEMCDIFHTFKKGHRIMVQVQSSWFPLVDRNPQKFINIRTAKQSDFQKATHRVYFSKVYPTKINVLVKQH